MTDRNISADEAFRIGLVNHVYPREELISRAMELAHVWHRSRRAPCSHQALTRELSIWTQRRPG